jgi:hypothetical protein
VASHGAWAATNDLRSDRIFAPIACYRETVPVIVTSIPNEPVLALLGSVSAKTGVRLRSLGNSPLPRTGDVDPEGSLRTEQRTNVRVHVGMDTLKVTVDEPPAIEDCAGESEASSTDCGELGSRQ